MQALTYHGRKDVRVETVPDPVLAAEDDLILRVTATAICGSDLHLYRGKIPDLHDGD
ncbi:alcohol dehydrogenase catalytic domain-containing protein, partial [Pseudomonas aeruginosa]|nr:alcohol dehydrogenase catalytic domain-containing protein [Pseudomonas aeruginosa]